MPHGLFYESMNTPRHDNHQISLRYYQDITTPHRLTNQRQVLFHNCLDVTRVSEGRLSFLSHSTISLNLVNFVMGQIQNAWICAFHRWLLNKHWYKLHCRWPFNWYYRYSLLFCCNGFNFVTKSNVFFSQWNIVIQKHL